MINSGFNRLNILGSKIPLSLVLQTSVERKIKVPVPLV